MNNNRHNELVAIRDNESTSEHDKRLAAMFLSQGNTAGGWDILRAEILPFVEKFVEWTCTDPDSKQYGRAFGGRRFEFKEEQKWPDETITEKRAEIDLNDYTDEEINDDLSPYGHTISSLLSENDLPQAEWLMAECIFEQGTF